MNKEVSTAEHRHPWPVWVGDAVGMGLVLAAGWAVLAPALLRGALIRSPSFNSLDQIDYALPLEKLAWLQVHHGQLPLWNPYSALGMPIAFTWNSAPFGVPALISYLFPLRMAYDVQIVVPLVIAGSGMYVLGRVLRLGVLGCVTAAVTYELGGIFMGTIGLTPAATMSWAGWLFAAALLVLRGRRRILDISFLAAVLAFAIYAGQPEILLMFIVALAVFVTVWMVKSRRFIRPILDLSVAAIAGLALSAPLLLPGVQVASGSISSVGSLNGPYSRAASLDEYFYAFGGPYYIGVITVVLAVVGFAFRRRVTEALSLGVVVVVTAALAFLPFFESLLRGFPHLGKVHWFEAADPMGFAIAALAGVGMDVVVRTEPHRIYPRWMTTAFVVAGVGLVVLTQVHSRTRHFLWPAVEVSVGLFLAGAMLIVYERRHRDRSVQARGWHSFSFWVGAALLGCETMFLVTAGPPLWSPTPSVYLNAQINTDLQRAAGRRQS